MRLHRFGLHLGPPVRPDDNARYAGYFWRSLHRSVYLSLRDPHKVDLVDCYRGPTRGRDTDLSREEYGDLITAMRVAHAVFVQHRTPDSLLPEGDHYLRAVLDRRELYRGELYKMNTRQVAEALHEEVKNGYLIFVPERDELRACVLAIRADREKRRSSRGPGDSGDSLGVSPADVPYGHSPGAPVTRAAAPAPVSEFMANEVGSDVNVLIAMSPGLQDDLKKLGDAKWQIEYAEPGRGSEVDRENSVIKLDSNLRGHSAEYVQTMAHEVGHATYAYQTDLSSKAAYLKGTFGDEATATMNNIRVQREILANGGPDIGIAGASSAAYNAAYDQFLKDGDVAACREAIGAAFGNEITSTSGQTYTNYYGSWYDKTYPSR